MHLHIPLSLILSACVTIFATRVCIYLLRPVAMRIGLIDTPGGRKMHEQTMPLIGGIAIFMGFCFSLLGLDISLRGYRGLLAGSAILILIGVMDDFRELRPRVRLIGQCLAALMLIQTGQLSIAHLGNLFFFGDVNLGVWSFVITVLFVLSFVNAVNLIDGIDGLAGGVILGQGLLLLIISKSFHAILSGYVLLLFLVAVSVFLAYNFPLPWRRRALVFLGDAGSTFLGFVIAWFAVTLSQATVLHVYMKYNPVTILWVIAFPLLDLLSVVFHRLRTGNSPFLPNRDHLHFLLIDLGLSPSIISISLVVFSFCLGLIGMLFAHALVSESWQALSFIFLALFYLSMTSVLKCKVAIKI
ncbi:MAG: hypothetical protein A3I77_00020 [Gammaproteobacteria bacterium RIFCSPLOWO2_02_FULL_42_14]|nr:MAG: hypothetical protein A3B71_00020 [Gammaproteobacteria bacterium RIFCSPHIGHO2_02_FULL_42_43]OGT27244.1 MAG: hypothetical protein A2624_02705 [Gammaproteobacteria bacterium RIFCSPHIGHO2_01_FULL_42_8]OGT51906.1 MAG: hypothetical protein A3E54_01045 [Gammaproteobacteria bacterium RIFCSPHIGHO2_12_FULL_41_25]OGT62417.1 MAG: hypothetical protein A3I77_00020 [Gammaproteobacteria bacterium RIFCSPLOWO2_02_FULL_42_14]OGT85370.1 MAG: hypothetical protein A3G86_07970 [Gammaproteobacteria bacterium R